MFLLTDKENKTFGDFIWEKDKTNETDNSNFYFKLFNTIEIALYLAPVLGYKDFNVWSAEGYEEKINDRFCKKFSKVKTIAPQSYNKPDIEKRTTTAILCSLNLVKSQEFIDWCKSYLTRKESFKEQAYILKESISDTDESSEYFSCAIPLLSSVLNEERSEELTSFSIFRAISDSFDLEDPIDVVKLIKISNFIGPKEIAASL